MTRVNRNEILIGDIVDGAEVVAFDTNRDDLGVVLKVSETRKVIMWMGADDTVEVERIEL